MKPRVLLVDDSPTARLVLRQALSRRGFEVVAVGAVAQLEEALSRAKPDLLLVDVHMPEMFGNDLVPWLREQKRVDKPILLCSTLPAEELERLAGECGADGWVRKNSRPDEVADRVERALTGGDP
jgi:DNA-binding response OmpR family regulator